MNYKKVMQCPYIDIKRKMQIFLFFQVFLASMKKFVCLDVLKPVLLLMPTKSENIMTNEKIVSFIRITAGII